MCVGNTHTLPSPVGAFADHSGKDAVFASVRVQSRFKHWPGLERAQVFLIHCSVLPTQRAEKYMITLSDMLILCQNNWLTFKVFGK